MADNGWAGTVMGWMDTGGWVMWILLLFSIVALAVGAERAIVLGQARKQSKRFLARFHAGLRRRAPNAELLKICAEEDGPLARVAEAGLRRFDGTLQQVEATLERHAARELRALSKRLGFLSTISNAAPLLGFLGTVVGMMAAFLAIGNFGQANPAAVAEGIGEAMMTTAAGLIVALPTQLAFNGLQGWAHRLEGDLEGVANALLEMKA
ncbi:MAG: MotA/TolQ/ExbB proton channel family protein [Thermoanaerobaculia bacterium]|nr:MotA/TolQ/ExbB proton channel family protein [Thermoanaerobaculia bacterium]